MTHRKSQTFRKGVDLMHNLMWYILTEDQRPTLERELGMDQKSSWHQSWVARELKWWH